MVHLTNRRLITKFKAKQIAIQGNKAQKII